MLCFCSKKQCENGGKSKFPYVGNVPRSTGRIVGNGLPIFPGHRLETVIGTKAEKAANGEH